MSRKTRKLIWSVPLVAVLAVAGALAIFMAQAPGAALAHDPPGTPGDVMAEAKGPKSIQVSWSAPSDGGAPTGYRIDRSEDGNMWLTHVENTGNTDTEYLDEMKVKPGQRYYYRVFAINSAGTGPVAKDDFADAQDASAPGMPTNVVASGMGQNKIVLMWDPPAKDGGSDLDKYRIHIWSDGGTLSETGVPDTEPAVTTADDAAVTTDGIVVVDHDSEMARQTYEHEKATAGTRYLYRIFAINKVPLTSTGSDSEDAETAALTKPGAPTGLRAVQNADDTIQLYWYAPADTGGDDISGYRIAVATKAADANFGTFADESPGYSVAAGDAHDYGYKISGGPEQVRFRVYSQTGDHTSDPVTGLESTGYAEVTVTVRTDTARALRVHTAPVARTGVEIAVRDNFGNVEVKWAAPASLEAETGPSTVSGYLIDVSDDAINWMMLQRSTGRTTAQYFYSDPEKMPKYYRILAWNGSVLGPAVLSNQSTVTGETPEAPSAVRNLRAVPVGPTQIKLSWEVPSNLGNAPIKRYNIQARMAGGTKAGVTPAYPDWPAANAEAGTTDATGTAGPLQVIHTKDGMATTYTHMELKAGQTWQYRLLAVNQGAAQGAKENVSATGAAVKSATTDQESMPQMPEGLTAEDAKDANSGATADRGVLLQWNAPNPPDGATIAGYRIDRKVNDGEWATLEANTESTYTAYTDEDEPEAGEMRVYRVRAISTNAVDGAWAMVYYPATHTHIMVPGMPTASAMADSDSQITVSWTAPADNGSAITGYIIERRYADDMVNDIPSDGYNDAAGGASFAFSNHKEWWETLNCKGMLAAAGSDEDPMGSGPDKMMYCAHYADTEPTNMAGTIMDGDATDMAIQALFNKRFVLIDDAMTMMYEDMGLMADITYTYRVSAVNGEGRGMWSAPTMATTEMAPAELMPPSNIRVNPVGSGGVIAAWDSVSGATGYRIIAINVNNVDETHSEFVNNPTATSGGLDGLTPGQTYNIFVASFDDADPPNYSLQPRFRQIVAE